MRSILSALAVVVVLSACEQAPPVAPLTQHSRTTFSEGTVPTVALDPESQTTFVAYFVEQDEVTNLFLRKRLPNSESWSDPVQVNSLPGEAHAHAQAPAQVVVGPQGEVYVVWTNSIPIEGRRFPASNLFLARSTDGGQTFSPQKAINTDADGLPTGHTFHDVAVAPDGTVYVSWLDGRAREAAQAQQATQPPVQPVSTHAASHTAHIPGTQVWVAHSRDGGETFSEGTVVAKETCQCCRTALAIHPTTGTVYVAWRHIFGDMERDMALAYSTDGGQTFSEPERLHHDGWYIEGCPHSGPALAFDANDNLHIAWYTGAEGRVGLYAAVRNPKGELSKPVALTTGVAVSQVKAARNAAGEVVLVWEDKNANETRVAQVVNGTLRRVPALLTNTNHPTVALGTAGAVVVATHNATQAAEVLVLQN